MRIQSHFAEELGKKILHIGEDETKREVTLHSVSLSTLTCSFGLLGKTEKLFIQDCRIILDIPSECAIREIPPKYCVTKNENDEYVPVAEVIGMTDEEKLKKIEKVLCECKNIEREAFFNKKTKERDYVWPRQIHMALTRRILHWSYKDASAVFCKDHATAIHAGKKVDIFIDTDREWKETFYEAFVVIRNMFKERKQAERAFDLTWMKDYD